MCMHANQHAKFNDQVTSTHIIYKYSMTMYKRKKKLKQQQWTLELNNFAVIIFNIVIIIIIISSLDIIIQLVLICKFLFEFAFNLFDEFT